MMSERHSCFLGRLGWKTWCHLVLARFGKGEEVHLRGSEYLTLINNQVFNEQWTCTAKCTHASPQLSDPQLLRRNLGQALMPYSFFPSACLWCLREELGWIFSSPNCFLKMRVVKEPILAYRAWIQVIWVDRSISLLWLGKKNSNSQLKTNVLGIGLYKFCFRVKKEYEEIRYWDPSR